MKPRGEHNQRARKQSPRSGLVQQFRAGNSGLRHSVYPAPGVQSA
jgi:hypothetical protein